MSTEQGTREELRSAGVFGAVAGTEAEPTPWAGGQGHGGGEVDAASASFPAWRADLPAGS